MDVPTYLRELLILRNHFNYINQRQLELTFHNAAYRGISRFWQPWIDDCSDDGKSSGNKQLPTTKWKRERRARSHYLRKSDPKVTDGILNGARSSSPNNSDDTQNSGDDISTFKKQHSSSSYTTDSSSPNSSPTNNNKVANDAPLDMTTKQRGLPPPSYSQAISDPNFRSTYTNSNSRPPLRDELPAGISMCDPIIDEHFRRSLGKDYNTVFSNNVAPKEPSKAASLKVASVGSVQQTNTNVIELMDNTGMSVDEHFAKALGDTWHKLNNNKRERSISPGNTAANKANENVNPTAAVST